MPQAYRLGAPACVPGGILSVGDVVQPGHDLSVDVGFLHRNVGHEPVRCGPVPMLLVRLDVDDVARADFADISAAAGDVTDSIGDVQV